MAITELPETSSPSSSGFLPSLGRNRRSSVISIASNLDKNSRNHTLDNIHNAASRSGSLTTFYEYAPPPSSSASREGLGITGDIQGSLSGLYSRFKESVGASKTTPSSSNQDRDITDDASSIRSGRTAGSTPAQSIKYGPRIKRNVSPAVSHISNNLDTNDPQPIIGDNVVTTPTRSSTLNNVTSNKSSTMSTAMRATEKSQALKPPGLMPFGHAARGAGGPTVASVNVDAIRDFNEKTSVPTSPRPASDISDHRLSGALETLKATDQRLPRQKKPGEFIVKTPLDSETSSIDVHEVGQVQVDDAVAADLDMPISGPPPPSNLETPQVQPNSEQKVQAIPRIQEPPMPTSQKTAIQQQLQLLGLTRAQSDSTVISSASTTIRHDDTEEEAMHTVAGLPYSQPKVQAMSNSRVSNSDLFAQSKNKLLSKEYWMKDENAKDCFYCGDQFSTFRRKHHCRTCGQIFDSKCTTLVSGMQFGQSGSIRVCKPCEGIIKGYDDSSEFSDDASAGSGLRPRHGSNSMHDISPARSFASLRANNLDAGSGTVPSMAIPTRRLTEENKRRSAILEIDAEPQVPRPGSSRSFKASLLGRSHTGGHRRHQSKHSLVRATFRMDTPDSAHSHNWIKVESTRAPRRLPAFHSDNVVDPDVADNYQSDDGSSENEQAALADMLPIDDLSKGWETEKGGLVGFITSVRKRSRFGDKSISGRTIHSRDPDNVSLSSAKMGRSLSVRHRNLSVSSNLHLRASPRIQRHHASSVGVNFDQNDNSSMAGLNLVDSPGVFDTMERPHLDPSSRASSELNFASIQHVRKMLSQFLHRSNIDNVSKWEKALIPIVLQASNDIVPDINAGDDIDIRHYIKLKKIPGGAPKDSALISGIVFTKNLALKSMPQRLKNPNVLILTFPLEYARHQRHFMSLDLLLRQEREYLQNLIHRIAALKPNLLLVERNISGLALEYLDRAGIATAYNVKRSVLEAVSRFAQTRIITSIDKLAIKPAQAGRCASFYLKTFKNKNRKKTYMFLSGCPKDLGCTILLRGADKEVLSKVKKITEFMTYVTYNLKLETSFMRDEFAFIPSSSDAEGTILPDTEPARKRNSGLVKPYLFEKVASAEYNSVHESEQRERNGVPALDIQNTEKDTGKDTTQVVEVDDADEINLPDDMPISTFYSDMIEENKGTILSCSPFVRFMQPYLVVRAREQERRLLYLKQLREKDNEEAGPTPTAEKQEQFTLITPDMIHGTTQGATQKVREVIRAVQDAQYEKAVHNYRTQKKQWETYVAGSGDMFSPLTHQNIVILYSMVCAATSIPCSGPSVLAIAFYNQNNVNDGFDADLTLGQFVEDRCLEANSPCTENACAQKLFEHRRQYVHGEGQLSVSVEPYPTKLRGLQDTILMWSVCRMCNEETSVTRMSDITWRYSYGKYLELAFWSHDLHARAGTCTHDLHKEHFRYFGFKNLAVKFQYDRIALLEIVVPRTRITWKVSNDLKFKNDAFMKAQERVDQFMNSVKSRIKAIKTDSVIPEKEDACIKEIERIARLAHDDHLFLTQKLQEKYTGSKYYEIIPFNRAIRAMQEKCVEWDNIFNDFDEDFFPSERDIRRLAQLQLKKIFLDRNDSMTSVSSTDEKTTPSMTSSITTGLSSPEEVPLFDPHARRLSIERAKDMLTAVVEDNLATPSPTKAGGNRSEAAQETSKPFPLDSNTPEMPAKDVQHLDLAVPQETIDRKIIEQAVESVNQPTSEQSPTSLTHTSDISNPDSPSSDEAQTSPEEFKTALLRPLQSMSEEPLTEEPTVASRGSFFRRRKSGQKSGIPLYRAHSQPANVRREQSSGSGVGNTIPTLANTTNSSSKKQLGSKKPGSTEDTGKHHERKISDRFGLGHLKAGINTHSMIPRSVVGRRKESKVSSLAKHFEELSREFERERLRDKKQRASRTRLSRVYPTAAAKPIIEEYHNFHEAVNESDPSDEHVEDKNSAHDPDAGLDTAQKLAQANISDSVIEEHHEDETTAEDTMAEETAAETTENEEHNRAESRAESDSEDEAHEEKPSLDDSQLASETNSLLTSSEAQLDISLQKHERVSLMKMLTSFWAERSASGWPSLEYPLHPTDHVFADSDVIVREDEPSSLVAFVLGSQAYKAKLESLQANRADLGMQREKAYVEDLFLTSKDQSRIERSLLQSTATHFKYQFQEGTAKMMCKVFFAEQFEAVRRKCGIDHRFIESLSRCLKWDSKGGKTKSVFLKTLDDRLVLKSLSPVETQAFVRFAPSYFNLMGEALFHELPSVIAKMVGFYQVVIKNPSTGVEFNWFLLVMENLFYDRIPTRTFDLKGSMRNRRIQPTGEQNEVLLDENMVDYIYEKPLFAREHSKRLIWNSVFNDTLFLARQNVMDYSLMVAIDENRKELVVGIIDCIRTYTWDKKLESWMKDRGKNRPTVTSPKEYKNRFRAAMSKYVLQAPTCWHQFNTPIDNLRFYGREEIGGLREEFMGDPDMN